MAIIRTKNSAVGDYFAVDVMYDSEVCPAVIPRDGKKLKSYNTTNTRHHLETNHEDEFATPIVKEKELVKEKDKMSSTGSSTQPFINKITAIWTSEGKRDYKESQCSWQWAI